MNDSSEYDTPMNSTNETRWAYPYTPGTPVILIGYSLIFGVGVLWNIFLMSVMIKRRSVCREPSAIFLFVLSAVDLFFVLTTLFPFVTAVAQSFVFGPNDFIRNIVCSAVAFINAVFLSFSVYILALISFDRFLLIVYSLRYERIMKPYVAWILSLIALVPCIAVCITPFFGFGLYHFSLETGACIFQWADQRPFLVTYLVMTLVPITLIIIFSLITYIHIRRFFKRQHRKASRWSLDIDQVQTTHTTRQRSLTRIFLALLITQAVCFLPGILVALVSVVVGAGNLPYGILTAALIIITSNAALNPIVQAIFRKEMRDTVHKIFLTIKNCCGCHGKEVANRSSSNGTTRTIITRVPTKFAVDNSTSNGASKSYKDEVRTEMNKLPTGITTQTDNDSNSDTSSS